MPTNKLMRQRAANILKGILPQAFGITAIFFMVVFFFQVFYAIVLPIALKNVPKELQSFISTLFSMLITLFVQTPLALGIARFFWRKNLEADDSVAVIFHYFSGENYIRALKYSLNMLFRVSIFVNTATLIVTFLQPNSPLFAFFTDPKMEPSTATIIIFAAYMLALLLTCIGFFGTLRYFLAQYLLINDENLDVSTAFYHSALLMRGRKLMLLGFTFSFFPWMLLCMTILPIMYVYPLIMIAHTVYAKYQIQAASAGA